jgi:hypothetical protein
MGKFEDQVTVISMTWVGGTTTSGALSRGGQRLALISSVFLIRSDDLLRLMLTEGKSELAGTYASRPVPEFDPARESLRGISASSGAAAQAVNQLVGTAGLAAALSRVMPRENDK